MALASSFGLEKNPSPESIVVSNEMLIPPDAAELLFRGTLIFGRFLQNENQKGSGFIYQITIISPV